MPWFKVDDGFATSPKVMSIPRPIRLQAIGLWTMAGTWSAQQLQDGAVPGYMTDEWGADTDTVEALVNAELWDTTPTGFQFHDWDQYQPTKAQVRERQKTDTARRASGREHARAVVDENFEAFWASYPKKTGKLDAQVAWVKAVKRADINVIFAALARHLEPWKTYEKTFIPNPSTWLNQDRWNDETPAPKVAPNSKAAQARSLTERLEAEENARRAAIGN